MIGIQMKCSWKRGIRHQYHTAIFRQEVSIKRPRISGSCRAKNDKERHGITGFTVPFTVDIDYFTSLMASAFIKNKVPPQLCAFPNNYKLPSRPLLSSPDSNHAPGLRAPGNFLHRCCYDYVYMSIYQAARYRKINLSFLLFASGGDLSGVN